MKKIICVLLVYIVTFNFNIIAQKVEFRSLENKAFGVGEKLTFDVKYGFVTAGIATMEVPKIKRISGRDAYYVSFKVNSVKSFDPFYKVRDRYITYIDTAGLFPWRFEQHIREGGYKRDFSAFFDQRREKVKTSKGQYEINRYVNDIVSAFYYFRTLDYKNKKIGDSYILENFYKKKTYPLKVVYRGKETVTVEAGTFDCIMIEPIVEEGGLFKSEGSIVVWLTDDDIRMPVKVKTKILIGSIDAELTKFEGLKSPTTSLHK